MIDAVPQQGLQNQSDDDRQQHHCSTEMNMAEASTCSHCEANSQNTSGVSSGASSVATVVQATDSAVLPRAR